MSPHAVKRFLQEKKKKRIQKGKIYKFKEREQLPHLVVPLCYKATRNAISDSRHKMRINETKATSEQNCDIVKSKRFTIMTTYMHTNKTAF